MNKQNIFTNILASSAFSKVHIPMMQKAGISEAIVIDELQQKSNYWEVHKEEKLKYVDIDSKYYIENWFFTTYDEISEKTGLSRKQVIDAVKNLKNLNLIDSECPVKSEKRTKWYKIHFKVFDDFIKAGDGSVTKNTYSSDRFIIYNKNLAKKIGPVNTIILSDLYTSYMYTAEINNFVDGEWFPASQRTLSKKLNKTKQTICNHYIPALADTGVVDVAMKSFPRTTHVKINFDRLYELLEFGRSSEYVSDSFFMQKNEEVVNLSEAELVTRSLLAHAEEISGQNWAFDFYKVSCIEEILKDDITEKQLIQIIDHMYKYYKDADKLDKCFNFANICGQKSKVKTWLDKIDRDAEKEEEKLYAEKVVYTLYNKMLEHSEGQIKYEIDATKIDMIRKRLSEELSEAELVEHMISRYDFLKSHGYDVVKNCSWTKLFGSKCFDDIQAVRNSKNRASYNPQTKKFKMGNPEQRQGMNINTNNDLRGKIDQNSITGVQGQDYF